MIKCPNCRSEDIGDLGYEDGGGDYGDGVTQLFRCNQCFEVFPGETFGDYNPETSVSDDPNFEGYPGHQYW